MNWLKSFLEETPGVGSSSRLALFVALIFCVVLPSVAWFHVVWVKDAWVPLSVGDAAFFGTLFGLAGAFKTYQAVKGE